MNIINRNDMVEKLNEYAFNNNIQPVIECLNVLLENKQQYQTNLDLIFMLSHPRKCMDFYLI